LPGAAGSRAGRADMGPAEKGGTAAPGEPASLQPSAERSAVLPASKRKQERWATIFDMILERRRGEG
jgi:hypothetical protein